MNISASVRQFDEQAKVPLLTSLFPCPNLSHSFSYILSPILSIFILLLFSSLHGQTAADSSGQKTLTVGLALSGGGARGIAHVGVLIALEEAHIPVDLVTGTSMGSIVGGLYAAGYHGRELKKLVDQIDWTAIFSQSPEPEDIWITRRYGIMQPILRIRFKLWQLSIPYGLINGQRISQELFRLSAAAGYAARSNFDSLALPYRAMAVDVVTGKLYALGDGSLAQAMRSSMAIPLVFYPAIFQGKLMVDGGVLDVLPTDIARKMGADLVIGVDVTEKPRTGKGPGNLLDVATNTLDIMVSKQMETNASLADVFIQPPIGDHSDMDYHNLDSLIDLGYQAGKMKIPVIKKLLNEYQPSHKKAPKDLDTTALQEARIVDIHVIGHKISGKDTSVQAVQLSEQNDHRDDFVRKGVVLGYFPPKTGDRFSLEQALAGTNNLYATGLFENVWLELEHPARGEVVINIHFTQKATRTLGFGANYYSDYGLSVFAQIVPFNFFGLGARFMPLFRYGQLEKRAGLEIANNRFFSTAFIFNGGGFYENDALYLYNPEGEKQSTFRYSRAIGQFSLGIQPLKKLLSLLGIRWERNWVQQNADLKQPAATYQYWCLFGNLEYDNRNSSYFPQRGFHISLQGETVLKYHIRGSTFSRLSSEMDWTTTLFRRHSLTPFAGIGFSRDALPVYEKFRLGGPRYLPGYHRDELLGNNMVSAGVAYRLRFYRSLYFRFNWSIANVFEHTKSIKADQLISGFSGGLALSTPVGPVGFAYGWNRLERDQFYFSIGYDF